MQSSAGIAFPGQLLQLHRCLSKQCIMEGQSQHADRLTKDFAGLSMAGCHTALLVLAKAPRSRRSRLPLLCICARHQKDVSMVCHVIILLCYNQQQLLPRQAFYTSADAWMHTSKVETQRFHHIEKCMHAVCEWAEAWQS